MVARAVAGAKAVGESFVSMLPNIVDRWRSQGVTFVVAIDAQDERIRATLTSANLAMERAGQLPWAQPGTGPAQVAFHGID